MTYFAEIAKRRQQYEDLAAQAVEIARKKGADEAAVRISGGKGITVSSRHCEVENLEFNQLQSLSVGVSKGKRNGSASTTDLSLERITETIESALNLCEYTSADECSGLCDAELMFKGERDLKVLFPYEEDADKIVQLAVALDKTGHDVAAQYHEQGLRECERTSYFTWYGIDSMATSHGFLNSTIESDCSKDISFIAEQDGQMQRSGSMSVSRDFAKLWDDAVIAKEGAERTLSKLGATQVKTGTYQVVLTRSAAQSLIGAFLNAISGKRIYRNSSFLVDCMGKDVFPEWLSIKEDPWLPSGLCSFNFDRDGVATFPQDLVSNGKLCTYLLSTYTGRKLKLKSNGHASGTSNLLVLADDAHTKDFDSLLVQAGSGLVIESLMGQGVNLVNGNYSRGASGYYFENGKRVHAVNEITIAGNLKEMFKAIAALGNDYDERYRIKLGSILLPLVVSGS